MVYVGGNFTNVTTSDGVTQAPIGYLARFNPTTDQFDTSWNLQFDGPVKALSIASGHLYVGGDFTNVGTHKRRRLASVNLATGALDAWNPSVGGGKVLALAATTSGVYVGGNFATLAGQSRANLGRLGLDGTLDSWAPTLDGRVNSLVASPSGTKVYAGGDFTTVSGNTSARSIASWDTATGNLTAGFAAAATNEGNKPPALDLYLDGTHLLAAVAGQGGACASLNPATGHVDWSVHANGNIQAVTAMSGIVYCGGHFGGTASFGGQTRHKLAAASESTGVVTDFAPRVHSALGVWSLGQDGSRLFAGGDFTRIGSHTQYHFGEFE
jgi:hypothetical protein